MRSTSTTASISRSSCTAPGSGRRRFGSARLIRGSLPGRSSAALGAARRTLRRAPSSWGGCRCGSPSASTGTSSRTTDAGQTSSTDRATSSCARPAKNGTTWMQAIVTTLLFPDGAPGPVFEVAPWIDARFEPIDDRARPARRADAPSPHQDPHPGRRASRCSDDASYIVVGRDGRDAYMSFLNHMREHAARADGRAPHERDRRRHPDGRPATAGRRRARVLRAGTSTAASSSTTSRRGGSTTTIPTCCSCTTTT